MAAKDKERFVVFLSRFMGRFRPVATAWCDGDDQLDGFPDFDGMIIYDVVELRRQPWAPSDIGPNERIAAADIAKRYWFDPEEEVWKTREEGDSFRMMVHVKDGMARFGLIDREGRELPFRGYASFMMEGEATNEVPVEEGKAVPVPMGVNGVYVTMAGDGAGSIFNLENCRESRL